MPKKTQSLLKVEDATLVEIVNMLDVGDVNIEDGWSTMGITMC